MEKILEMVKEFIETRDANKQWVPGKDWVQYSGPYFGSEEITAAVSTLLKGWLVLGEDAIKLEKQFPSLLGKQHGIVVNSGSSANLLMIESLKSKKLYNLLKNNTKIIAPAAGFPTTLNPILQAGFEPRFVDIELDTLNIDSGKIELEAALGAKVLMFAHVLGNPPNMNEIMSVVNHYNLILLEDCCDALGSTYDGKPLGSFGEMSSCSFYPAHHITCGEGGFIACKTKEQEKVIRSFREWGRGCYCVGKKANLSIKGSCGCRFKEWIPALPGEIFDHKYSYEEIGYNLKPIELQCSILLEQVKKLPDIHQKRKYNYDQLFNIFKPYENFFILPKPRELSDVSWFAFPLTIRDGVRFKRSDFCRFLEENKIQTRNYFGGNLLLQPAYSELATTWGGYNKVKQLFPNATKVTTDTFFLGVSPVITDNQLSYIKDVVDKFMGRL